MAKRKHGSGSIEKRGNSYRVRICVNGQRRSYNLKDVTKKQAEEYARDKSKELEQIYGTTTIGPVRFSALLRQYETDYLAKKAPLTQDSYAISLKAFETYWVTNGRDPIVDDIRKRDVVGFLSWRRTHRPDGKSLTEPLSARSLEKDRAVLSSLMHFAEDLELIRGNPVRAVRPPKGDQREPLILDDTQYDALVSACANRPMLQLYVLVLGEAGLRSDSEALWLRWDDVDLEKGQLTVESVRKGRRTKSGRMRVVPMTRRLRDAMRGHFARFRFARYNHGPSPWIFHHSVTRRHAKAGDRITKLRKSFYGAAKKAELPSDLRQHDLRHRRVTTWLAEGKPAHLVQKAMGHSDIRVTLGYSHLVADDLMQLVEEPTHVKEWRHGS